MPTEHIIKMKSAHKKLCEFPFRVIELDKGYANRWLKIDLTKNEISIHPITQQMKELWTGGKGFDLWLTIKEITKDTKWNSPENPICFSPGPLGGTTSFPGTGKTLVTAISPLTHSMMDCNVGGYFGPYLKFAGFDALMITGKANKEIMIFVDAVRGKITIETSPEESIDSHILAEELTEMYSDDELDYRNIACVSAGRGADHTLMGVLNFSFWDWRRNSIRLKQAGRGGVGTVFRDKKLKALVIKNREINPAWRIEENKVAKLVTPKKIYSQKCPDEIDEIHAIIDKWNRDTDYVIEMMLDIQNRFHHISKTAIDEICKITGQHKAYLYHIATFYRAFSLEPKGETIVQVCTGSGCQAKGAGLILDTMERTLGIKAGQTTEDMKYTLEAVSCLGVCEIAPVIKIGDELIGDVHVENIKKILETKREIRRDEKKTEIMIKGIPSPIAMRESNASYSVITEFIKDKITPEKIISDLKKSGLKGRGGGGFLTAEKWEECRKAVIAQKSEAVLVCNSAIVEPSPHAVIEGMLIGALATGATEGHVCFRQEHLAPLKKFEAAVEEAIDKKLLGRNILESALNFEIKIHRGGGGFIIGESSALLQTISGRAGEPQPKYIHNTEKGYKRRPTVVNNIETWANIPVIFEKGADWFKNTGKGNGGTKVLFLSGDVKKNGFVEVPIGTTIREVIDDLGEGISKKKRQLKAVQFGGPSGSFLPANLLDTKIDYDTLKDVGSIMGSGTIVVKNNRKCIVDAAKYSVDFLLNESCGKCTPCREGLFALSKILFSITNGEGTESDIQMMHEIAQTMKESSLCKFGQTAANPILSMIEHFNDELDEHIDEKICRSGVCKSMVSFSINQEICNGCALCLIKCPSEAIVGEKKKPHQIITAKCTKCGVCFEVCNFESVEVN